MTLSTTKGSLPLYAQIKSVLVARITDGTWLPGEAIPSEMQLAEELAVSQGTVRKAINDLVEENVFVRQQGRGTFVSAHDSERALFHFFHLIGDDGSRALPDCRTLSCRSKRVTKAQALELQLEASEQVVVIERVRNLDSRPTIAETIVLPASRFGGLTTRSVAELPNTLYALYQAEYGITIHQADEKLRAIAATDADANLLDIATGAPLLEIHRVALTLDGTAVEIRTSRCSTEHHRYHNTVS